MESTHISSIARRHLLRGASALAGGPALRRLANTGSVASALLGGLHPGRVLADLARADAGNRPSPLDAWPDAFANVPESFGPTTVRFDRPLPRALDGTLYRNGPARMRRGDTSYRHWFDGDGMVQSFGIGNAGLVHRGRMVRTSKYLAEEKAGRFLERAFGTAIPGSPPVSRPDDINVANTSMLAAGDELLALWEAGSPWRIHPRSLETLGRKVWSPETDGAAFSAHPKVDRDGTIWSFGYLPGSGKLILYRLDPRGELKQVNLIDAPNADMVHDFAVTERWLAFVLMPLELAREDRSTGSFVDSLRWRAERAGVVLLVDKATLEVAHRIETPPTAFFHLGNAWEDGDTVRLQVMRIDDFASLMDDIYAAIAGEAMPSPSHTGPVELAVTPRGARVSLQRLSDADGEFPRIDPRHVGQRTRYLFHAGRSQAMPRELFGMNVVARLDVESGRLQRFDFGPDVLVEEHVFVPSPGTKEGSGWLLGTAWNRIERRTMFSVFDAEAVEAGPIARAALPYGLPLGLHGTFVPS
jgi:carotenoid cleavage dioxygenase